MQNLNYSGQESKNNLQFMIRTYLWPWNKVKIIKLVEPKRGYDHAKFERPPLNNICQKANTKVFVKSQNMSIISHEDVHN